MPRFAVAMTSAFFFTGLRWFALLPRRQVFHLSLHTLMMPIAALAYHDSGAHDHDLAAVARQAEQLARG
jgi:hypothetical protein